MPSKNERSSPFIYGGGGGFNREFSISTSHNSNAIEGNTFTYDETKLLIEQGIVSGVHSWRESEDIVGYSLW